MASLVLLLVLFVVGFTAIPGLVVLIFVWQRRARRRRAETTAVWAATRGWTTWPTDPAVAGLRCPPVEQRGEARHVVHGADPAGHPVVGFEWSYWVSSSNGDGDSSSSEVLHTVVATTVPGTHPMLQIAPGRPRRGFLGIGGPDPRTVTTGVAAFDQRFTMVTDDPAHAARTVGPRVLEWLAIDPRAASIGFRLHGSWVVTWQDGGIEPARLDAALAFLDDLRDEVVPEGIQGRPGGPAPLESAR